MSEEGALLNKAAMSFDAAETLVEEGYAGFSASRAYYGCFYVAEALLLHEGLSFSRHAPLISEYGRLYSKTGRLEQRFHRLLGSTFAARLSADYDVDFDLPPDEVRAMISEGREFLQAARDYLESTSSREG